MENHGLKTVPVTVHLTESEIQSAIERGIKTALTPSKQSQTLPTISGSATGHFDNQWRGTAQW